MNGREKDRMDGKSKKKKSWGCRVKRMTDNRKIKKKSKKREKLEDTGDENEKSKRLKGRVKE